MEKRYMLLLLLSSFVFLLVSCQQGNLEMNAQKKQIAVKAMEDFASGDFHAFAAMCTPDYVEYQVNSAKSKENGLEASKKAFTEFHKGIPDMKIKFHSIAIAGDTVFVYNTISGIMKDTLMGIPPLNKEISLSGIDAFLINNGKISGHWGFADMSDMNQFKAPKEMGNKDSKKR